MQKAFSYVRFSSPQQALGDSLRRQIEGARQWAESNGYELDESLRDEGVSAFKGANKETGALGSFLERVKSGEIPAGSVLIVESLDRLSRETVIEASLGLFALIKEGITVVTLSDNQIYDVEKLKDNWTPLIISLTVMARAHEESRMKSERVGKAWSQKKEKARKQGTPLTVRCPEWLRVENGKFKIIPERVKLIKRIYQLAIDGHGQRSIVRILNDEKIPAFRTNAGWQTSSLAKVLKSRALLGEYQPHSGTHRGGNRKPDGEPIRDFYPQVIDEATFYKAQASTQARTISPGRRGESITNLFQGLMRCQCGSKMHVINKGSHPSKGGKYYVCYGAIRKKDCSLNRHYRIEKIEENVIKNIIWMSSNYLSPIVDIKDEDSEELLVLTKRLEEVETIKSRLLKLYELGDDTIIERIKEVSNESLSLKSKIKEQEEKEKMHTYGFSMVAYQEQLREALKGGVNEKETRLKLADIFRKLELRLVSVEKYGMILQTKSKYLDPYSSGAKRTHDEYDIVSEDVGSAEDEEDLIVSFRFDYKIDPKLFDW